METTNNGEMANLVVELDLDVSGMDLSEIKAEVLARIKSDYDEAKKTLTQKLFDGWKRHNKTMVNWYLKNFKDNPGETIITKPNPEKGPSLVKEEKKAPKVVKKVDKKKKALKVVKKVDKKKTPKKAEPKKPEKKTPKKQTNINEFNHREGSIRAYCDALFLKSTKIPAMTKAIMKQFDFDEDWATANIKYHVGVLKRQGFKVTMDDEKVTLKSPKKK